MPSILFTMLDDSHFDELSGSDTTPDHLEALEGYGIDATEWIPFGGTRIEYDYHITGEMKRPGGVDMVAELKRLLATN